MAGPEYTDVEKPFIDQLVGQGWEFLAGSVDDPAVTHRESFAQVVMEPLLRKRLRRYRLGRTRTWMRLHIWMGLVCLPVILVHAGFGFGGR